jgi:heme-degrading monooxygenase HmoA
MIARIATFPKLPPEVDAEVRRNVLERFMPALRAQEGFVAGYWVANEDGTWVSFSVWESKEAHERGGQRANATPLLPGQDPAKIPAPMTVELYEVIARA